MRIKFVPGRLSIPVLVLSCLVMMPSPITAQADEKEKAKQELERRQELERKTLGLLDEIAAGAWGLKLPENRVFVLANAADILWPRDEKRARNMLWDALNSIAPPPALPAGSAAAKNSNDRARNHEQYLATYYQREEFLRRVARRDPQLALDMLRASRLPPPEQVTDKFRLPDVSDLEQQIASEAAARDPQRALQIAREGLSKGLTFQVLNSLFQINQRNADVASEFAGDIVDKIQSVNVANDPYAPLISVQLLRLSRTQPSSPADNASSNLLSKPLKLSDEQKRDLVEALVSAALSTMAKGNLLSAVSEVMPEIEQFAPDRAVLLTRKLAEFNRTLSKEQQDWRRYDSLFENGTLEEMLKAAANVSGEARESFYQQAILKAVMTGRTDSLRELIGREVEDESRRKSLLDSLDSEQINVAAGRGRIEELQNLLPLIRLKEQRATAMAEIAVMLEKKGQHDEAVKLLDEAQSLIKIDLKSETQSEALMTIVLAYSLVDPPRAFAIIEPIIDRVNDDISRLLLVDKILKSQAVKKGEIVLQGQNAIPLDFAVFKYGKGVAALANADFNRTKAAADRFQRNELRILARLMLARALLQSDGQIAGNSPQ